VFFFGHVTAVAKWEIASEKGLPVLGPSIIRDIRHRIAWYNYGFYQKLTVDFRSALLVNCPMYLRSRKAVQGLFLDGELPVSASFSELFTL